MTVQPKLPPGPFARVLDTVRRRLRRIDQKLVPAPIAVQDMMTGAFFARAIYTAAKFGVADVLSNGALTAEAIAQRVDANPDAVGPAAAEPTAGFRCTRVIPTVGPVAIVEAEAA